MNKKAFALSNSSLTPYSIPQVPQGILPLAIGKMNLYLLNKVPSLSGFLLLRGKVLTPLMPHPQDKHSFTFQRGFIPQHLKYATKKHERAMRNQDIQ